MTNRIAFALALLILALVGLDFALGTGASIGLARRFLAVLDWLAFWR